MRSALLIALLLTACSPSQSAPPSPPSGMACEAAPERHEGLVVAGSGSNLALARFIVGAYRSEHPKAYVRVPESIGTGGAVRALVDGAVDIGLASRPLTRAEKARGVVETPLARSILAVVAHPDTGIEALTTGELEAIFRGERRSWDSGVPMVPLLREKGDSGAMAVASVQPGLFGAMEAARERGLGVVMNTDQEMRDGLWTIEGSIGLLDLGIVRLEGLPLRVVRLDGVAPSPQNVAEGRYGLVKDLAWLTLGAPSDEAARVMAFARRAEVVDGIFKGGYLAP